jgi:hypothetical protein
MFNQFKNEMKMRKSLTYAFVLLTMAFPFVSCDNSDNNNPTPEPTEERTWGTDGGLKSVNDILFGTNRDTIGNGDSELVFKGTQTIKKGTYYLKGWIYIADGSTLTIEPGTVIRGDKKTMAALIAERGGKLIAQGTASSPIVFTSAQPAGSRKPGDWGGIILCGKAPNNQNNDQQIEGGPRTHHGGSDASDNSGILSYVRIEFAGYPFQKDKEINGLTLGSVGDGTQIDHVQVSFSNDDSFEWFGGTVNCNHLVAYSGWDDDFDTDNGFSGNVQFGLAIRNPRIADQSQSNGFESDNDAGGDLIEPYTKAVFSNITFIGPMGRDGFENTTDYITGGSFNPNNGSALGKYQTAMHIRRASRLSCFNSVVVGWPIGIILDGEKGDTQTSATKGLLNIQNVWFAALGITGSDANKSYVDELITSWKSPITYDKTKKSFSSTWLLAQPNVKVVDSASSWNLTDGINAGVPFRPQAGSPLLDAASFTSSLLSSFTKVSYIGAFGANDTWLDGWTNFDPENTNY